MIFDKISPKTDFFSKIQSDLFILNKNVLYITHECDKIKKIVTKLEHKIILDNDLQSQVDEFFEDSKQEETVEQ